MDWCMSVSEKGGNGTSSYGKPLCLKCRRVGHIVDSCPVAAWRGELDWFFSEERRCMDFITTDSEFLPSKICPKCRDLDLLALLREDIPWTDRQSTDQAQLSGSKFVRSLGNTGTALFWSNCALCRCLFALIPNPRISEQEIFILPQWTITRLEGGAAVDNTEKRKYAKCLLALLHPSTLSLTLSDRIQRGDALCIADGHEGLEGSITLAGRRIEPDRLNADIVDQWVSTCCRLHHATCFSTWSEDLEGIRLLDIRTREVISYPGPDCEYIALSYVCGGVVAQSFKFGRLATKQSQTIEDAIVLVKRMGKHYLWVDSLCIDQHNALDKKRQINKLSHIYRGAFLTIIALTGESANAGLPRVGEGHRMFSQLQCHIDGAHLVGLMPTLSQLIWVCPWGSRAWTLQEALLSPRCLYVSAYQLYFECNAMQCSESLNETKSWVHQLDRNVKPAGTEWSETTVGGGVLRHPLVGLSGIKDNSLIEYGSALALYSNRKMTESTDAINAFAGILQNLENEYGGRFFCGLPVADFQWGLLWIPRMTLQRRANSYPSWSWAAWDGPVWQTFPSNLNEGHSCQPYLHIWKISNNQNIEIFASKPLQDQDKHYLEVAFPRDCVQGQIISTASEVSAAAMSTADGDLEAEKGGYDLLVEGVALRFAPDYSLPILNVREHGRHEVFRFLLRGIECRIRIISIDAEVEAWRRHCQARGGQPPQPKEEEFLLVARERSNGWVLHHLLLLEREGEIAARRTVLTLLVPDDYASLSALEELRPSKTLLVLR